MNSIAKIACLVTVSAFCAVGFFASPVENRQKNKEMNIKGDGEIAYCEPEPIDVSSAFRLAQVDPDPT